MPDDHEGRLTRLEQGFDKLTAVMIDLAEMQSKVEDQLLRFLASQGEINARLDRTLAAILDLLQRPPNGH
jgi:hypothetical protein